LGGGGGRERRRRRRRLRFGFSRSAKVLRETDGERGRDRGEECEFDFFSLNNSILPRPTHTTLHFFQFYVLPRKIQLIERVAKRSNGRKKERKKVEVGSFLYFSVARSARINR
jgi:hypothetical protein